MIPRNQYRLYNKLQDRKKLPWLLKLYTRSDDESLIAQFSATPENITLHTLQNCAKEGLQIHPFEGFGHGEIIAHPELMAEEIKRFINS